MKLQRYKRDRIRAYHTAFLKVMKERMFTVLDKGEAFRYNYYKPFGHRYYVHSVLNNRSALKRMYNKNKYTTNLDVCNID